ncbi:chloride conductance regulatory protein ICln [Beta vulgaris subsp. vulgaris]|uniref:chloride conductance regulatory protein ICln n=1 Tax=Beta vulgaris subsp. vulgaris TaxID=3555 RepID=UPI00203731F4|nr:chloride conductance regulatory protein ICln [Beta vulgaris subsp. vulgaris]
MAVGLRIFAERTGDGAGQPILDADNGEVLMHTLPSVSIVLGNRAPESPGTLYISSKKVIWLSDVDRSRGYAVDFVSISLHAVSRDIEAYPSPCIYTQIETGDDEGDNEDEEDEEQQQTVDWSYGISEVKEMRLVPSDSSQLETLFEVFCECAELNPEPRQDEDTEEHNWIFSADQLNSENASNWTFSEDLVNSIGHSNGHHDLAHNVLQLHINDQCFEDAEEMDQEHDRDNNRQ